MTKLTVLQFKDEKSRQEFLKSAPIATVEFVCDFCKKSVEEVGKTKDGKKICWDCFKKQPAGEILNEHDLDGFWTILCEDFMEGR